MKTLKNILALPLVVLIYIYKYVVSPLTPASCRHYPTCSEYSIQAIKMHGPLRGSWLAVKRISSCHPWGTSGIDPVPRIIVKKVKLKNSGKSEKIH
ncbi:MAG: membrane protein insertion efficiency factor YidD [Bacteroidales bacterium]|nr:membrane protein insertion efficiency factor YidD [Bacteroidales bacterium]